MPIRLRHLNIEMAGGLFQVGEAEVTFGVCDVTYLIEPRHCVANMSRIRHRFLPCTGKGKRRVGQERLVRRGKTARTCHGMRFPSRSDHA